MHDTLKRLKLLGIVPVVKLDNADDALPLADALIRGGLPCAEITFRTDAAEEAIRRVVAARPDMLVGAGTIITVEQAKRAIDAGSAFIVSPGFNPKVVQYCIDQGVPVTPGCINPTDIGLAVEMGLDVVKFFPAEQSGGLAAIKALAGVFGKVAFMPTGGISAKNLVEYLAFDKIIACGGSWMVKPELIAAGDFAAIETLTREAVQTMLGFHLHHVGINNDDAGEAARVATGLCRLFGFTAKEGNSSIFAGPVEVMKSPFLGKHGHIAIGTNSMERAVSYLESQGFAFASETAKRDEKGNLIAIYLKEELGGFALHLVRK